MKKRSIEMGVGTFVLVGFVCIAYLALRLGQIEVFGADTYELEARFASVGGLERGSAVKMAGVTVGKVSAVGLDPEYKTALVTLQIRSDLKIAEDAIASIRTSGLIGDKFISLQPGGSSTTLEPGGAIVETESAVDIEGLISKMAHGDI